MRVATITCHDVYNYGASLQAYALQQFCEQAGADYHIIDYKPDYLSQHFKLSVVANPRYNFPIVKQLYLLAKLPGRIRDLKKKRIFDNFTTNYLHLTSTRYHTCDDIRNSLPEADLYIAGSDQIWNTLFRNGHDSAFYLDFVGSRGKKISYAASFATDKIHKDANSFVSKMLRNFNEISVRETSALQLLSKLGQNKATLVCDPVFLLNRGQWIQLLKSTIQPKEDYILVYDCERSSKIRNVALKLKEQTSLPIYILSKTAGRYADKDFSLVGPLEFLSLILNARYVIANSFHATAFSIIFHKEFFIVNRSESINTRMHDFLSYLGIPDRIISTTTSLNLKPIDFIDVSHKLDFLINESKSFINKHLQLI